MRLSTDPDRDEHRALDTIAAAAETDAELRRAKPSGRVQDAEATQIAVTLRLPRPVREGDVVGTLRVLWRALASTCCSSFRR